MDDMNSFTQICSGKYFKIPDNQRGFSWDPNHLIELLEDLTVAHENREAHYLGPVIISRAEAPDFLDDELNTVAEYILEDGQQRLTCFFLIAAELKKQLAEVGRDAQARDLDRLIFYRRGSARPRLQNVNPALQDAFTHFLMGAPSLPAELSPPMRALRSVSEKISSYFGGMDQDALLGWKASIENQAKFVLVDLTRNRINRYLAFDAINSRGLPLSEFDKIKNFSILLAEVRKLAVKPEDEWYKAITNLEGFGVGKRGPEADFITELYNVFHKTNVATRNVHEAFVERYKPLLKANEVGLEQDLVHFVKMWEVYARSFGFVTSPNRRSYYGTHSSPKAGSWLDRLDNLQLPTISRPILVAAHHQLNEQQFEEVARAAEIYAFRVYAVQGFRSDMNKTGIIDLAHTLLRGQSGAAAVLERYCSWLVAWAPLQSVVEKLGDGGVKYYHDPTVRGWASTYYFLFEYERWVSPTGVPPIEWASTREAKIHSQEHILPQKHRDGGWWESHWPDEGEADRFKHRIGNLVLTPANSALGRKPMAQKLSDPQGGHSYTHVNATNAEKLIANYSDGSSWSAAEIRAREETLLKFATERWNLPCCGDEPSVSLPGEFGAEGATVTFPVSLDGCYGEEEGHPEFDGEDLQPSGAGSS